MRHCLPMAAPRPPPKITAEILLRAYAAGLFPMADSADDPDLFWVDPERRGIFPLESLAISRSLAKTVRSDRFEVHVDRDFEGVIDGCAAIGPTRNETWINATIRDLCGTLFRRGHVHTVEAYRDGTLAGGLYGLSLNGAFFGESMFHRATDASKVCLLHLAARLRAGGYRLLDTQFVTPHLATLGAVEVPRATYRRLLAAALHCDADFRRWPMQPVAGRAVLAELEPG